MIAVYDTRRFTEQALNSNKIRDRRLRTGNRTILLERYITQFIIQILLARMRATIRESDKNTAYTLEGLLAILNVMEYDRRRGLSKVTKNFRLILRILDIEVPKEPIYHGYIFDPYSSFPLTIRRIRTRRPNDIRP